MTTTDTCDDYYDNHPPSQDNEASAHLKNLIIFKSIFHKFLLIFEDLPSISVKKVGGDVISE